MNGRRQRTLPVTSRYSWYYGQFPWTNLPEDGGRRQLYDDARLMFGRTLPTGTRVRFQVGAQDTAPWYVIDLADFELVRPPREAPDDALDVTDFGADATGQENSTDEIQAAKGTGRTVWLPEGTFTVTGHLIVDDVTMRGAGPWYSVLHGKNVGVYGRYAPDASADVHLRDFAIFGETTERVDPDQVNAIGGSMNDSTIENLWLQHNKVGVWMDGPFDNLHISRLRILDQTADGLNFHDGVTNSSVTDTYVRSTGDDGLAMWSEHHPDTGSVFAHNTVKVPVLANNLAIYGGEDIQARDNLATDTVVQGGGIQIANRFGATPLAGTTTVAGNLLVRTGTLDLFSHIGNGALLFWGADGTIDGRLEVRDNVLRHSAYEGIQFLGSATTDAHFEHDAIDGAGTFALQLDAGGSATFRDVTARDLGIGGIQDCGAGFHVVDAGGNAGWSDRHCRTPVPGPLQVTHRDETLRFETDEIGRPSELQTVTVTNPTGEPQRIASVSITGAFTLASTCGEEVAPGASCTVDVRFVPSARGDRGGSLTISDGTSAGRYQVHVRGVLVTSTEGNLAAGKPMTASGEVPGFPASNAADSNTDTYWESTNNALPQWLTVDLGSVQTVSRVAFKINPGWGGRTQTLELLASADGTAFSTVVPAADQVFDPGTNNNTVELRFPTVQTRFLRVEVTGNTGWPAGQIAEFEAYAE